MRRRHFLGIAAAAATAGPVLAQPSGAEHPLWPLWTAWRDAHLDFSGRVVDAPQRGASHSEGQSYGMSIAVEVGDEDAFRRMAAWTQENLAIRGDALLAWRWLPDVPERVPDLNNASDGDLFHAWALLRGAERFGHAAWRDRAAAVASDLVRSCVASRPDRPGQPILLPAAEGFTTPDGVIVNPSYMMPLAMREVAAATGQPELDRAATSGLSLMSEIAQEAVVPDWLELTPEGRRAPSGFSHDAGYEALRVPLFLAWSGEHGHPALARAADAMARAPQGLSATVLDAETGTVLETSGDPGYRAVAALSHCAAEGGPGAPIPPYSPAQPYYPSTLHMFVMMAQIRTLPACLPI
ncbi:glycosyl hydrolase family 8 [Rhodosalinus sp.]|uniref:glycosyl hydrolase family 8 n=1 Tax=Rhodosalinus sp. TaxID=2047741 RepID=UPI00397DA4DA